MRRVTIAITMVLILASAVQISYIVDSFPGFHSDADCSLCHNEPATAYNESFVDAEITLDGFADEEFWSDSNYFNSMQLPVAKDSFSDRAHQFIVVKFAQNSTHLFVWMDWEDYNVTGSDTNRYSAADGALILWNAHPGEYEMKDGWFGGMKTDNPGEEIDVWGYKAAAADDGIENTINATAGDKANLTGNVFDTMFDDGGWDDDLDTSQDVQAAATWGNLSRHHEDNFGLEFARPLVTNDPGDVQFDKIGYYEFAIAIFNDTSGGGHAVSFEHQVFIYGECDENCELGVEYIPTTVVNNVTITETTTEESAPVNFVAVLTTLFSAVVLVRLIPKKKN